MPARFRSCHLRLRRYVACSRGSAQSFGPTHGRGETESAPVHLRPPDINARMSDARNRPSLNRHRPDMTALAAQVNDRPMSLALLEVINGQLGHLVTPEPTRKQDRKKSSVPFALEALPGWRL